MAEYDFFPDDELKCKCDKCKNDTENHMDEEFMNNLIELRKELRFAFVVNSAYRCKYHPIEARKESPGAHNSGKAIDIKVSGVRAYKLLRAALNSGFGGIGVSQKGNHDKRFIHLDMDYSRNRPAVWSY